MGPGRCARQGSGAAAVLAGASLQLKSSPTALTIRLPSLRCRSWEDRPPPLCWSLSWQSAPAAARQRQGQGRCSTSGWAAAAIRVAETALGAAAVAAAARSRAAECPATERPAALHVCGGWGVLWGWGTPLWVSLQSAASPGSCWPWPHHPPQHGSTLRSGGRLGDGDQQAALPRAFGGLSQCLPACLTGAGPQRPACHGQRRWRQQQQPKQEAPAMPAPPDVEATLGGSRPHGSL